MRLVCPNCGAQYEIDDRVLPETGRDVQCSNCGHAWFQKPSEPHKDNADGSAPDAPPVPRPAESLPELAPDPSLKSEAELEIIPDMGAEGEPDFDFDPETDLDDALEPEPEDNFPPETDLDAEPDSALEADIMAKAVAEAETEAAAEAGAEISAPPDDEPESDDTPDDVSDDVPETDLAIAAMMETQGGALGHLPDPKRRELDDGVRDILRDEADIELEARAHDREQIETQTDMDLNPDAESEEKQRPTVRERVAKLRGLEEDETATAGDNGARRELLPDIDEINSSLESTVGVDEYEDEFTSELVERRGFRRGFLIVLLLAIVVVVLYLYAPVMAAKWPALEPIASGYVDAIDKLRGWVDGLMQTAITKMQNLADAG